MDVEESLKLSHRDVEEPLKLTSRRFDTSEIQKLKILIP
jgi:hypothetical protein